MTASVQIWHRIDEASTPKMAVVGALRSLAGQYGVSLKIAPGLCGAHDIGTAVATLLAVDHEIIGTLTVALLRWSCGASRHGRHPGAGNP